MSLRDAREWLAETLDALASKLRQRPVEVPTFPSCACDVIPAPALQLVRPAVCPGCDHSRGRHRVVEGGGRGPCLAPGCDCTEYGGPWPVHHLHVTTERCSYPGCDRTGGHWAVQLEGGALLTVPRHQDLPGEFEADQLLDGA